MSTGEPHRMKRSGSDLRRIQDGFETDPGWIHYPDPSRLNIFFPAIWEQYVGTINTVAAYKGTTYVRIIIMYVHT